ncbi:recombination mediator RecR [Acidiluteibacter ferrifornacis]|uniref:Recombination protein RecR n=1 Tax=Acidiluteibacter ferrifornacis TaxID=2692424 RepID=A0A6N9NIW5_9FLAO|nr:recombination mediator RecR [Acidiluteibacter ferrifornacis]NBG65792.1 recombination protein RecR [Acidiluteibacter ferrifornacis]
MGNYPSKLLSNAVEQFSTLPGIGRRTALRLVLHLLKKEKEDVNLFGQSFIDLRNNITYCQSCHNISDTPTCDICSNSNRDSSIICVVEDVRDVMAIENTQLFKGKYHVLGGIISPMDGIGPNDLNIDSLIANVNKGEIKEVIMALSATMEGDTTNFYIYKKLKSFDVNLSTIARGVAIGDELEYADEITLGRSIQNRIPFEQTFSS